MTNDILTEQVDVRSRENYSALRVNMNQSAIHRVVICHCFYILICLAGFGWQFLEVSLDYFSFSTATRIKIQYPSEFDFPALTLCARYTDILDHSTIRSQLQIPINLIKLKGNITIKQIFDWTPNEYELIEGFYRRKTGSYSIVYFKGPGMNSQLDIKKFIYSEYICYKISLRERIRIRPSIEVHPIASGIIGKFTMTELFKNVSWYKLSLHDGQTFPYESLNVQPTMERNINDTRSLNTVSIFPTYFTIKYMKPPYSTKCIDYAPFNFESRSHCIQTCIMKKTVDQLSKFPFSSFIFDPSDQRIVSYTDANNPEKAKKLNQIATQCEKMSLCGRLSCESKTTITHLHFFNGMKNRFNILLITPQHPWIEVDHEPSIKTATYFTLILGAFGVWTGLSIISLSPFRLFLIRKLAKKRNCHSRKKSRSKSNAPIHDPYAIWRANFLNSFVPKHLQIGRCTS